MTDQFEYNPEAAAAVEEACEAMIEAGSVYVTVYNLAKHRFKKKNPDAELEEIHEFAKKEMGGVFLSHLWIIGRRSKGLSTKLSREDRKFLEQYDALDPADFNPKGSEEIPELFKPDSE